MATTAAELIAKGEHLLQNQLKNDQISIPLYRVTPEQIEESLNNLLSNDASPLTNADKAGIVAVLFNSPQWKNLDKFVEILKFDDLKNEQNEGVGALLYQINKRYAERIAYQTDIKLGNPTAQRTSYDDIKNENRIDLFPDDEIKSRLNRLFMNKPEYSTKSSPPVETQQSKLNDQEKTNLTETNTEKNDKKNLESIIHNILKDTTLSASKKINNILNNNDFKLQGQNGKDLLQKQINNFSNKSEKKQLQKEFDKSQGKTLSIIDLLVSGINSLIGKTPGETLKKTSDSTIKIYFKMGVSSSSEDSKLNMSKNTEFDMKSEIDKTNQSINNLVSAQSSQQSKPRQELVEQINELNYARNYLVNDPKEKAKITSILSAIDSAITQQMKQSSQHKKILTEVRNNIPHDAKPLILHSVTKSQNPSPHTEHKMNRQRGR